MQKYSDFFQTLHDEQTPTGYLGRGTHYSVMRAVTFHDARGKPFIEGQYTDFAVIWDEDHDTRVIEPIEEIYRKGFLSSFLMFGERKGSFTAILSNYARPKIAPMPGTEDARLPLLKTEVSAICQALNDPWPSEVIDRRRVALLDGSNPIISDEDHKVNLYLDNLQMLWQLGTKTKQPQTASNVTPAFDPVLLKKVDDLEFSIRTNECLKRDGIVYVGDLVLKTEAELLRVPNFGRRSLNEVKEALASLDLHLGMEVQG
jgi:hypothetical protein